MRPSSAAPTPATRIAAIDTTRVLRSGVLAVLTAAHVEGRVAPIHAPIGAAEYWAPPRPLLPASEVRFAGEPVAVVVAQTAAAAVDAAERVRVDYEALEPVVDMERAASGDGPLRAEPRSHPTRIRRRRVLIGCSGRGGCRRTAKRHSCSSGRSVCRLTAVVCAHSVRLTAGRVGAPAG
jgi:CO/xanthine dehydrogenase Mo-binding subunit